MKTMKLIKRLALVCLVFTMATSYGQDIGGIVKRKVKKRANTEIEKTVDKGLDVVQGKNPDVVGDGPYGEVVVVSRDESGNYAAIKNFIDPGSAVFVDDFNNERVSEFPSRWTQVKGALENNQIITNGEKDGVLQTISSYTTFKPTIKGDNYLGDQFKIEMLVYFNNKGNEGYYINLKNSTGPHNSHDMRISPNSMKSGGDNISRMPASHPQAGWHTFQISFNKGYLKAYYDGVMLINDPSITTNEKYPKNMFTHLEIEVLSPSVNKAVPLTQMITYFAIGGKGHTLYDRLVTDGRLVMNNINFEVNSYTLAANSYGVLDGLATMLIDHPEVSLNIHGHTDSDGTKNSNQTLSENRAKSVMNYLTGKGVDMNRLTSSGYGEEMPVDDSGSETAKAKNRRVEFVLKK